ncbi:hypothetical protein RB653_010218 [Dictyostelium firmibasis]|uniref:Uncharacterized protein n=1 Tax=Dictyostelium firmibasis TaxID=79012 RepID=A0AAN7TTE8_9MYCE
MSTDSKVSIDNYRKLPQKEVLFKLELHVYIITAIIKSIKDSLGRWKSQAITMKAKMAILKTYALSRLSYHQYIDSLNTDHIEELNNVIKWFLFSSIKHTYIEEKKYRTLMTMDRAFGEWKDGGIKMWDLGMRQVAFKIWNMNRLLEINKNNLNNTLQEWYFEQIRSSDYKSISLRENVDQWKTFRNIFFPQHGKLRTIPDCIRNSKNRPLKLKEIYSLLLSKKFNQIRKTEGQKDLIIRHNINLPIIFQFINQTSHQKGRNTLFRFFSRTLPGINYIRNTQCKICNNRFSDPYIHFFIDCNNIKNIETSIVETINKLSFLKIRHWNLDTMNVSNANKKEKIYINLITIITHQLWIIICYKLFNEDVTKPIPLFDPLIIEKETSNLIKLEKFKVMKKIEQNLNNNNNTNLLKIKFNNFWQSPTNPIPIP